MKRFIVDTNIILSALIKDSTTRDIIFHISAELYFLPLSAKELGKYEGYILQKTKKSKQELHFIFEKILEKGMVLDESIIKLKMPEAKKIMDGIDPDDTPFIAAALALHADIWSDDKHFEKQKSIKIWKTQDLVRVL